MVKRVIDGLPLREFASKYGYNLETVKNVIRAAGHMSSI